MNITNKFTSYMLALALLAGLNGCSSMSARERSTAIGAGVGAAVGAVATGGFIGTSIGAAAGAVVGNQMGKK